MNRLFSALDHRRLGVLGLLAVFAVAACGESEPMPMGPDLLQPIASFDVTPQGDFCAVISLDNQDPPLVHGSIVTSLFMPELGFSTDVSVVPGGPLSTDILRVYDTNITNGPDFDLQHTNGTCNPAQNGGQPGCLGQDNVLVIQDAGQGGPNAWDNHGDARDGGVITFSGFAGQGGGFYIEQFKAIDDDVGEPSFVALADGVPIGQSTPLGDGTVETIFTAQTPFTNTFEIIFARSGAVDDIVVCAICTGEIGDFVWNDAGGTKGLQDVPPEVGLAGVRVVLKDGAGNVLAETVTDANGFYLFSGLCAGDYEVMVDETTVPAGWMQTPTGVGADPTIDNNPNPAAVNLPTNDASDLTIDFGYMEPCTGEIGDFVWNDSGGTKGIQDPGEVGLAGIVVNLYDGAMNLIATTTTDANGFYLFSGLCAGDYKVEVDETTIPAGWMQTPTGVGADPTIDNNVNPSMVNLPTNDASDLTIDFGYMEPPGGGEGCTPGYYKNLKQHLFAWTQAGYDPNQSVASVFSEAANAPYSHLGAASMREGLDFQGGDTVAEKAETLLRHAIAAVINADNPNVDYAFTSAQIVAAVNAALASQDANVILSVKNELAYENEQGCPLNNAP